LDVREPDFWYIPGWRPQPTITVWDSGMYKANMRTGKKVSPITPIFSLLARIR